MNKKQLLCCLIQKLENDLELLTRAALLARDEAIDEESRAESKWDTRGQEAAYLAEGQANLAQELRDAILLWQNLTLPGEMDPSPAIEVGRVFVVEQSPTPLRGLIGPKAGGVEFEYAGDHYTVVTPGSPLGKAVLGKRTDDFVNLMVHRKPQPHRIISVH